MNPRRISENSPDEPLKTEMVLDHQGRKQYQRIVVDSPIICSPQLRTMHISSLVQFTLGLAIDELYKASHGSEPQRRIREAMRHLDVALSRIENPGPNDGPKPPKADVSSTE